MSTGYKIDEQGGAAIVKEPEDYIYSSASDYAGEATVLPEVELLTLSVITVK